MEAWPPIANPVLEFWLVSTCSGWSNRELHPQLLKDLLWWKKKKKIQRSKWKTKWRRKRKGSRYQLVALSGLLIKTNCSLSRWAGLDCSSSSSDGGETHRWIWKNSRHEARVWTVPSHPQFFQRRVQWGLSCEVSWGSVKKWWGCQTWRKVGLGKEFSREKNFISFLMISTTSNPLVWLASSISRCHVRDHGDERFLLWKDLGAKSTFQKDSNLEEFWELAETHLPKTCQLGREFGRFLKRNFQDFFHLESFWKTLYISKPSKQGQGKHRHPFFLSFLLVIFFFFPSHNQPRQEPFLRLKLFCVSSTWKRKKEEEKEKQKQKTKKRKRKRKRKRKKKKEKEWWIRARGRLGRFRIASCCVIQPGQYLTEWSKNWGSSSCQEDCQDSNEGHCLWQTISWWDQEHRNKIGRNDVTSSKGGTVTWATINGILLYRTLPLLWATPLSISQWK